MHNATINMVYTYVCVFNSFRKIPEVELMDHMVILFLIF